jgi:hypothetical protein
MLGYFQVNHIKGLLTLYLENKDSLCGLDTLVYRVSATMSAIGMAFFGHTHGQARLNAVCVVLAARIYPFDCS